MKIKYEILKYKCYNGFNFCSQFPGLDCAPKGVSKPVVNQVILDVYTKGFVACVHTGRYYTVGQWHIVMYSEARV